MRRVADLTDIALRAIWANKLRSFLTILGNIVAVGSIIAVVSLIQGVNATVEQAEALGKLLQKRNLRAPNKAHNYGENQFF